MPVRGHGHYKRPYRLRYTDSTGRVVNKAYHWPKGRQEDIEWLERHKIKHKAWTVKA